MKVEAYTVEQIKNTERFLDIYAKLSEEKKPIVEAMLTAFIGGMETQERLAEVKLSLDKFLN